MPFVRSFHILAAAALGASLATGPARAADTARWVTTFPSPTENALEFERRYGGVAFANIDVGRCGTCTNRLFSTSDTSGSFLRWTHSNPQWKPGTYLDHAGILLPLDPIWSWNHDLRKVRWIRMKVRSSRRSGFRLGLEGPAAPFASIGLQPESDFQADRNWSWQEFFLPWDFSENEYVDKRIDTAVATATITFPDSLGRISTATVRLNRAPALVSNQPEDSTLYESDSFNVLKHVRALKILVQPTQNTTDPVTLDVDSITFEGIPPQWGRIRQAGACQGRSLVVDRESPPDQFHLENLLGGKWERTLDTSSSDPNGMATGFSSLGPQPAREWSRSVVALMDAKLDRLDPRLHPDGGWARISTWLRPDRSTYALPDLKAISFRVQAGQATGLFDSSNVHGVTFRLHSATVPDSVAFSVRIPYDSIRPTPGDTGRTICIQLDELRQPGWYTGKAGIHGIDPTSLTALSWTLSLDEPTASRAKPSRLTLWDAKLWTAGTSGAESTPGPRRTLQVRAIEGHLAVSAEAGRILSVRISDLSGRRILDRSLGATGGEQFVALPRRGDLLVASISDGSTRTQMRILPR